MEWPKKTKGRSRRMGSSSGSISLQGGAGGGARAVQCLSGRQLGRRRVGSSCRRGSLRERAETRSRTDAEALGQDELLVQPLTQHVLLPHSEAATAAQIKRQEHHNSSRSQQQPQQRRRRSLHELAHRVNGCVLHAAGPRRQLHCQHLHARWQPILPAKVDAGAGARGWEADHGEARRLGGRHCCARSGHASAAAGGTHVAHPSAAAGRAHVAGTSAAAGGAHMADAGSGGGRGGRRGERAYGGDRAARGHARKAAAGARRGAGEAASCAAWGPGEAATRAGGRAGEAAA